MIIVMLYFIVLLILNELNKGGGGIYEIEL